MEDTIRIEVTKELHKDLLEKLKELRDKYYAMQVTEKDPETKNKILKKFMSVTNIIQNFEE